MQYMTTISRHQNIDDSCTHTRIYMHSVTIQVHSPVYLIIISAIALSSPAAYFREDISTLTCVCMYQMCQPEIITIQLPGMYFAYLLSYCTSTHS